MTLKQSDIEALVELFGKSDWDELHVEIDGEEILLSNDSRRNAAAGTPAAMPASATGPVAGGGATVAVPATAAGSPVAPAARNASWVAIKAANLGTYYRAASPEAAPYVSVGTAVTAESEVCMIEVMKLFTTIRAGLSGIVREICVKDGQMVEFGQDLMWIEPV